jgi:hypothetical protein
VQEVEKLETIPMDSPHETSEQGRAAIHIGVAIDASILPSHLQMTSPRTLVSLASPAKAFGLALALGAAAVLGGAA